MTNPRAQRSAPAPANWSCFVPQLALRKIPALDRYVDSGLHVRDTGDMPQVVMALGHDSTPADARWADADRHASELFAELRAPLRRYIISLGLSPHDADEVAQETFLRLHSHLLAQRQSPAPRDGRDRADQQERPEANLRGWIFRVAQNLAHDQRRRSSTRAAGSLEDSAEAQQAIDAQAGPEQRLLQDERTARLHAAMQALPPRQQQCLRLRAEGLRYREIAEALGIGVSTVADAIHQALTRLGKECQ
jgi:RNA polymerase sigma-70 factor (ECF subfamily)